jgi:hypothetical protein
VFAYHTGLAPGVIQNLPGRLAFTGENKLGLADKGYDTADFVAECRNMEVTPHVAQNDKRRGGSAIDARATRHAGYRLS